MHEVIILRRLEKKATEENIRTALAENTIKRNTDLAQMISIIRNIGDGYSIALNSKWGTGKTFFVKQMKLILDAFNPNITQNDAKNNSIIEVCKKLNIKVEEPYLTVYYDSWKNDNDIDPILSLLFSIIQDRIGTGDDFNSRNYGELFCEISDMISKLKLGAGIGNALKTLKKDDLLSEIKKEKDLQQKIESFFEALLPEKADHLLIIIDELDRCKPSYAVTLLERIKHYFDYGKVTFLFATNLHELVHSIKHYYGDDFDATGYLDRFFDIVLELPEVDPAYYFKQIMGNSDYYVFDNMCEEVIKYFGFGMREITRFCSVVKSVAYNPTHETGDVLGDDRRANKFVLIVYLPILIGLRMKNQGLYKEFIEGHGSSVLKDIFLKTSYSDNCYLDWLEDFGTEHRFGEKYDLNQLCDKILLTYDYFFLYLKKLMVY